MDKLIVETEKFVKKVPSLPQNIKDFLAKFAPWGALITVVLLVPAILTIVGFSSYFGVWGVRGSRGFSYFYAPTLVFMGVYVVLRAMSIKGLFARSIKGWNMFFYSILAYFVYAVVSGDIFGGLINAAISLYLAFQIKEYFK